MTTEQKKFIARICNDFNLSKDIAMEAYFFIADNYTFTGDFKTDYNYVVSIVKAYGGKSTSGENSFYVAQNVRY